MAACGSGGDDHTGGSPSAGRGKRLFAGTCVTCHGQNGEGVPSIPVDLRESRFVIRRTDDEMIEFLMEGMSASDSRNSTGIEMPPRAGNPALTDADLADIVAYLRSVTSDSGSAGTTEGPSEAGVTATAASPPLGRSSAESGA